MDTNIVEAVINNLATLLPVRMVYAYERGVRFRAGVDKAELQPGLHWFIPGYDSIETVNICPETRNLPTQTVITRDGKSISFSCNVCYKVVDARKNFTAVQNFDESMQAFAMVHLASEFGGRTYAALRKDRESIEADLAETLSAKVAEWGAEIEWIGLTDITETRAYRLFGDTPF